MQLPAYVEILQEEFPYGKKVFEVYDTRTLRLSSTIVTMPYSPKLRGFQEEHEKYVEPTRQTLGMRINHLFSHLVGINNP